MTDPYQAGGAELRPLCQSLDGPSSLSFRRPSTPPERPNLTRLARKAVSLIRQATEGDDTRTAVELRAAAETMAESFAEAERQEAEQARLLAGDSPSPDARACQATPTLYPREPGRR